MKLYCIIALSLLLRPETAAAQQEELMTLSLQQAIEIAQENSPGTSCPSYLSGSLLELPFFPGELSSLRHINFISYPESGDKQNYPTGWNKPIYPARPVKHRPQP